MNGAHATNPVFTLRCDDACACVTQTVRVPDSIVHAMHMRRLACAWRRHPRATWRRM